MTINNIKYLAFGLTFIAGVFWGINPVRAQYYSQGEQKYSVVVDKTISDVVIPDYFDNISFSKKIFREKDKIDFKIVIKNSGNSRLVNLKVVDFLPNYLQVINGFNTVTNNTIETNIESLDVGQTKTYNVRAAIANTPVEKIVNQKWQVINKVCVSNDKASDCDNATYFVGGKVMPITGNESLIWQTMLVIGTTVTAVGIKRMIRGY